jgi:hypothetical protein
MGEDLDLTDAAVFYCIRFVFFSIFYVKSIELRFILYFFY